MQAALAAVRPRCSRFRVLSDCKATTPATRLQGQLWRWCWLNRKMVETDRQREGHTHARTHTHTHTRHTDTQADPMHILHRCTHAHAHTRTHTPSTMALKPASPKLPFPGERTWIVWLCLSISQNSARSSAKVRAGDTRSTTRKCSTMNPQRQRKNTHTHTHTHKGEEGGRREGEQAQMKTRANSNAQPFLPQTNLG